MFKSLKTKSKFHILTVKTLENLVEELPHASFPVPQTLSLVEVLSVQSLPIHFYFDPLQRKVTSRS